MYNRISNPLKRSAALFNSGTFRLCLLAIASMLFAACKNGDGNTGNNKDTTTTVSTRTDTGEHHNMQREGPPEDGMTMIHKGMDMAKSGKEMMERGTAAKDKDMMERGMNMMEEGMNMINMGKDMLEKDNNAMAGAGMKDHMGIMDQGMNMMTDGKNVADSALNDMDGNMGGMNKGMRMRMHKSMDMMDKGMDMMNKAAGGMGSGMKKGKDTSASDQSIDDM